VIESFADWLGMGLANLVTLLDPELVVVGGGLADVADLFVDRAREVMVAQSLGSATRPPARLEVATLGSDAGVIGAALVAVPSVGPAPPRR
jgi:glucokinase